MSHYGAILWKQWKDIFRNKTILIQFVMFPVLTVIMENAVKLEGMPEHFFACLFGVMYLGMAPFTSVAAVISEEKEKRTLRALLMANVKPAEYLCGITTVIWIICLLGSVVIAVAGDFEGAALGRFIGIMAVGVTLSCLMGAVVGTMSRNQMEATSVTVPVMMVFSFLPMLAMFNDGIEKIAKFTYTGQIHRMLGNLNAEPATAEWISAEPVLVIAGNMILAVVLFAVFYRRTGLE